jgi:hypothetical protein
MPNVFSEIENSLFSLENMEDVIFDEEKISDYIVKELNNRLASASERERPFVFQEIIYNFFEFMRIPLIKSSKTRDNGLDGVIKLPLSIFGEIDLGLQIKYSLIGSPEIDSFQAALRNSELQLGVIACKDSRELVNYDLNNRIRAILFSRGIELKERLINEKININPVYILKLNEIVAIVASEFRGFAKSVYKK